MVNALKLKSKIVECGMSIKQLAEQLGIDQSTFYRRLKANGETFTVKDVSIMVQVLHLKTKEACDIFFAENSHIRK